MDCRDISVILKDNDPRLTKSLTMAEFNVVFGVFRDIIFEEYPDRRQELDTYLAIISDLAMSYGGTLFYEYHKSFSSKAAMYIYRFNQKLDWSVVDLALISRHFTGHRALSFSLCSSFSHSASLCPKTASSYDTSAPVTGQVKPARQTPVCFNFNENVCTRYNCKYFHACSYCGNSHPRFSCPRRTKYLKQK